ALYGHPGHVECRSPDPDECKRSADEVRALAQYADEQDVKIALEPMSHFRTHLINTPRQLKDFLELVGHENAWGLLDTYHLVTEIRDYEAGFRLLGDKLFAVHACENDRGHPRPDGLIPWDSVFRALKAVHFDGYVMMESYNSSIEDFAFERGMFHNVCPDGEEFVREGLGFLRQELTGAELAIGD
ncbi:MAG: sugar phosphate isomerase/epimerase family protein, partial [Candidatus Sumerlaeota bacterium]